MCNKVLPQQVASAEFTTKQNLPKPGRFPNLSHAYQTGEGEPIRRTRSALSKSRYTKPEAERCREAGRPIYCPSDYLTSRHRSGRKTDQSCQAASLHCIFVKPEALPRQLFYLTLSWVRATAASGTPELIRRPPELDKPQAAACRCQC